METPKISNRKKCLVLGLLGVIVVGHAVCVLQRKEWWPFSRYPMYSFVHLDQWTDEYLMGTTLESPGQEFPISFFAYDRPISIKAGLDHLYRDIKAGEKEEQDLRRAMHTLAGLYEQNRGGKRSENYQKLHTLRFYRISWRAVPGDRGIMAKEVARELIMEIEVLDDRAESEIGGVVHAD